MSRSGYSDDCDDNLALGRWRGRVASAIRGKRGQKLLTELLVALEEMPVKKLITEELQVIKAVDNVVAEPQFCTLGVLGAKRGIEMESIDPEDYDKVAGVFDIASPLAQEIVYLNDEENWNCTPEERWVRMRDWVKSNIKDKEGLNG